MMSLFDKIIDHIPEYKEFNKHIYKVKKLLFITRIGSKVVLYRLLRDKLFNPQDKDNQATNDFMPKLGRITATAIIEDFQHKLKVTRHYLPEIGGYHLVWLQLQRNVHL